MKVSVLLTAYNHEKYVGQAVESALMQGTNFAYEIVIGEDCSTDTTRDIAITYSERYPDKIRLILSTRNLGENHNIAQTLAACRGQYVAMLDGDDYWTCLDKLQRQVDLLDDHPEWSICCHNAISFYEDRREAPYNFNPTGQQQVSTLDDLWEGNFIATCSAMFRRDLIRQLPEWYYDLPWGDWPLYILCSERGKIGYVNEVMGAYRIHGGGAWSGLNTVQQLEQVIEFYEKMNVNFDYRYSQIIDRMRDRHVVDLTLARTEAAR